MFAKRIVAILAAVPLWTLAEPYEIGEEMSSEPFWKSDPVLFVKRHAEAGFEFTSDDREGAASRQDGGVSWHFIKSASGLPRLVVPEHGSYTAAIDPLTDDFYLVVSGPIGPMAGGIERVELVLFATGGTEAYQSLTDENGKSFRRRVRVEKTMTREEYGEALKTVPGTWNAFTEPRFEGRCCAAILTPSGCSNPRTER